MTELLAQAKLFWRSAELVNEANDPTSATVLYFKCAFVLLDVLLEKRIRKVPKDHTERFRLLEKHAPDLYAEMDKYFPIYRSTYNDKIERNQCDEVKNYVDRLAKAEGIALYS